MNPRKTRDPRGGKNAIYWDRTCQFIFHCRPSPVVKAREHIAPKKRSSESGYQLVGDRSRERLAADTGLAFSTGNEDSGTRAARQKRWWRGEERRGQAHQRTPAIIIEICALMRAALSGNPRKRVASLLLLPCCRCGSYLSTVLVRIGNTVIYFATRYLRDVIYKRIVPPLTSEHVSFLAVATADCVPLRIRTPAIAHCRGSCSPYLDP